MRRPGLNVYDEVRPDVVATRCGSDTLWRWGRAPRSVASTPEARLQKPESKICLPRVPMGCFECGC